MSDKGIPKELKEKLARFDTHLSELEAGLNPVLSLSRNEMADKLEPIDAAKTDLVSAYAINSLFWMYMNVCGVNPKEHAVKQELTRIQSYMQRVKEIEDKKKAPKIDKGASKRFIRSALWLAAQKKQGEDESLASVSSSSHSAHNPTKPAGKKRKRKSDN